MKSALKLWGFCAVLITVCDFAFGFSLTGTIGVIPAFGFFVGLGMLASVWEDYWEARR